MVSPDDIFPKLTGNQFYSTFDFCKGYWAIPMAEESKDIRYDTRCYFNVRSKADISQLNLPHGTDN